MPGPARSTDAPVVMKPASVAPSRSAASGPFAGFRRDHTRVLARLAAAERDMLAPHGLRPGAHARLGRLVALLERQFATHMAAEDTLLYPLLADVLPESRSALVPLAEDHAELRSLLASVAAELDGGGARRDERIAVQLRDLIDLLRLHIRREETAVFEVAERILGQREARALEARLSKFVSLLSPRTPRGTKPSNAPRRIRKRSA